MSLRFVLAKVTEKNDHIVTFEIEEHGKSNTLEVSVESIATGVEVGNVYLFKLVEGDNPILVEALSEKDRLENNLSNPEDVSTYVEAVANMEGIKAQIKYSIWDSENESKVRECLELLKGKGIEISGLEGEFEVLLKKKEEINVEKGKNRIKHLLERLEKNVLNHKWNKKGAKECLKEIMNLKKQGADTQVYEKSLNSLEKKIMSDEKFSLEERHRITQRVRHNIFKLESLVLQGKWDASVRRAIANDWENVKRFGLESKYLDNLNRLDKQYELIKAGKFENPFNEDQIHILINFKLLLGTSMVKQKVLGGKATLPSYDKVFEKTINRNMEGIKHRFLKAKTDDYENYNLFCLEVVRRDASGILLLSEPTEESCIQAINKDVRVFKYLENKSETLCLEAVKKDGMLLKYVEKQTPEMCMIAMEQNPESIAFFKI